jgi:hypothetical protein
MKSLAALSAVLLAIAALPAEELKIREVRLGMTYSPMMDVDMAWGPDSNAIANEETYIQGNVQRVDLESSPGWRLHFVESFGTIKSHGGLILGLSFGQDKRKQSDADNASIPGFFFDDSANGGAGGYVSSPVVLTGPVSVLSTSFDVHLAYAIGLTNHIHCELGGFAGGGSVAITDVQFYSIGGAPAKIQPLRSTGGGNFHEVGLEITTVATFDGGFQAGLTAAFVRQQGENTLHTESDVGVVTFDVHGLAGEFFIGYRF